MELVTQCSFDDIKSDLGILVTLLDSLHALVVHVTDALHHTVGLPQWASVIMITESILLQKFIFDVSGNSQDDFFGPRIGNPYQPISRFH